MIHFEYFEPGTIEGVAQILFMDAVNARDKNILTIERLAAAGVIKNREQTAWSR